MKKPVMLALTMMLSLSTLGVMAGCSQDVSQSEYLGKWTAVAAEMDDYTLPAEDIFEGEFSFDLQANGDVQVTFEDDQETGKWTETENGFIVENEFEVVVEDGAAEGVLEYSGVDITFQHE